MGKSSRSGFLPVCIALLFVLVPVACQGTKETVELSVNGHVIRAEIADTNAERATGLMNRDSLPENSGMLFVYLEDQHMSFWMKNTRIPLSIAFISRDGVIREIRDMEPYSLKAIESANAVRYALEMPKGYFDRLGIKPGDVVAIPESVPETARKASGR